MKLMSKVQKLIRALQRKNIIYLLMTRQVWNSEYKKNVTIYRLSRRYSIEEYKKLYPNYKPRKKLEYKEVKEAESTKLIDIVLYLSEIYKEVRMFEG